MQSKFKTIGLRGKKKRLDHGRIGLFSGLIQNFQWASLPLSYGSPPPGEYGLKLEKKTDQFLQVLMLYLQKSRKNITVRAPWWTCVLFSS